MKLKRTTEIKLVLIGVTSLFATACDDSTEYSYFNRDDCIKEWAESECENTSSGGKSWWRANVGSDASPRTVTSSKAFSISRGGFGSSAHSGGSSS